ncbi:MAG: STAS domain-containing protein [Proteobacteria bacterium]|nr:STAS domain-containing protein [Pseudomonadota bacterium]
MRIEGRTEDKISVISVHGNMALEENVELKKYLKPYLEDENLTGIVLDLKNVAIVDSSGIDLIVSTCKLLISLSKKFALASLTNQHRETLNMTRLDKIITIAGDSEIALEILKSSD